MTSHKAHLMSWVTGRAFVAPPERGAAAVVVEDGALLAPLAETGLIGPDTVVYAPRGDGLPAVGGRLVGYRGSFGEAGAEVQMGDDFFLQVQAYSIAAFLAMLGPTAVRLTDEEDIEAFLADADDAVQQGNWSEMLTNPVIQLADVALTGGHAPLDGPRLRLFAGRDGTVRLSPSGPALGTVGSTWAELADVPLGPSAAPGSEAVCAELTRRSWLTRYHCGLGAQQALRARGVEGAEVSGFGLRFGPDTPYGLGDPPCEDALAPVLLRAAGDHYVYVPRSGSVFQAPEDTALALERVLTTPDAVDDDAPSTARARRFVAAALGTPERQAA